MRKPCKINIKWIKKIRCSTFKISFLKAAAHLCLFHSFKGKIVEDVRKNTVNGIRRRKEPGIVG